MKPVLADSSPPKPFSSASLCSHFRLATGMGGFMFPCWVEKEFITTGWFFFPGGLQQMEAEGGLCKSAVWMFGGGGGVFGRASKISLEHP